MRTTPVAAAAVSQQPIEIFLAELSPSEEAKFYQVLLEQGDYKPSKVDHSRLPQIDRYKVEARLVLNKTHFIRELWIRI